MDLDPTNQTSTLYDQLSSIVECASQKKGSSRMLGDSYEISLNRTGPKILCHRVYLMCYDTGSFSFEK
jgi:hypothetical protein